MLLDGRYCDGLDKVFPLRNHTRSVIAMTGSYSVTTSFASAADACSFMRNAKINIDFREIAKSFLESKKGSVTNSVIKELETILTAKLDSLLPKYPGLVQADGGILNFSFAQYLPAQKTVNYIEFHIVPTDGKKTKIQSEVFDTIRQSDDENLHTRVNGAGICFQKATLSVGRRALGPLYLRTYDGFIARKPRVDEVSMQDGSMLARDLIDSTVKYSDMFPMMNCQVGGTLRVYKLDQHLSPVSVTD